MSDENVIDSGTENLVEDVSQEIVDESQLEVEESESTEGEEVSESTKKEPWYQRRINELTRDKHEARRQAERLEQVLKQQEELLSRLAPKETPVQDVFQAPDPEDYVGGQFDPRYMQDMMIYTRESAKAEAIQAVKAEQQEAMQRQAMVQQQQRLETAEAAARAKYQDYDGVIEQITSDPRLAQNATIRQALLELDNGPEIAYTLGRNLDVAYEIANMNPIQAGMRLAEIINRAPRRTSNAPTPIRPINAAAGSTPGNRKDYSEMSTEEYIAARNAEDLARRQARMR
jgi:myosin heavy subunit